MVQNQTMEHDWIILADQWTAQTKPEQPEIDICALVPLNGKPELSLDAFQCGQNVFKKWKHTPTDKGTHKDTNKTKTHPCSKYNSTQ